MNHLVKTPCNGICSTVFGDLVCRGCKRFNHEVINWNLYSDHEKQAIWQRLNQLLAQVITPKLKISQPSVFEQKLKTEAICHVPLAAVQFQIYQLLVKKAHQIRQFESYGLRVQPAFGSWTAMALKEAIEHDYLQLSAAYYQRRIAPGLQQACY